MLEKSKFAKHSLHQTFPPYGIATDYLFNNYLLYCPLTTEDDVFENKQFQDDKVKEGVLTEEDDHIKDDHCANDEEKN